MNTIGNYAPDFEIPGIDQEVYHLGSYLKNYKAIAVVFMANNSSHVDLYIERLKQIQTDFANQDFTIIAIDSNHRTEPIAESMAIMKEYAQNKGLNFPYLRDSTQDVAKSFKAKIVPMVYLIDSDSVIRYQGSIDDCSESMEQVNHHYLRESISHVLSGNKASVNCVEPTGDKIEWRPK